MSWNRISEVAGDLPLDVLKGNNGEQVNQESPEMGIHPESITSSVSTLGSGRKHYDDEEKAKAGNFFPLAYKKRRADLK